MNWTSIFILVGYMVVFFAALWITLWWRRRQRRTKPPFPENFRLLRMPGEYLSKKFTEGEVSDFEWLAVMMGIPIVASALVLRFFASHLPIGVALAVVVMLCSMCFCIWWLQKRWRRAADDYLGFFGERYVAECLDILKADGWFVFHDIQFHGATGKFNFDHAAVGPGGVWVVETKTRRKGRASPGSKEHVVEFDGSQIVWPWGEETDCLAQASNNARSMREWLEQMTGKSFPVAAVVTFPGYKMIERALGPVRVANPKNLPLVLVGKGTVVLAKEDIDLIRRQLEEKCRDVEY